MTLREALRQGTDSLINALVPDASYDAGILMEEVAGLDRSTFWLNLDNEMEEPCFKRYSELIEKRAGRIPLQYILGRQEFMGLNFIVNNAVLIPRQDTEILAEEAIKVCRGKRVLDLCTGSGCLAICIDKLGSASYVVGSDISEMALEVSNNNSIRLNSEAKFIKSNMFNKIEERFDLIVSNPPYVASAECDELMPEVREHEPILALDGGIDGFDFYRIIAEQSSHFLNPDGLLMLEIGCRQGDGVCSMLEKAGFRECTIIKDLAGLDRVVSARI